MPDTISLTGVVATDPRHITTNEGLEITSFRLASSQRRFDKSRNSWIDTGTNWYTVTAFRQLAANMAGSLNKGDRVVASGRLRVREWTNGEKNGTTMEIEAEALGHDLSWGTASFSRSLGSSASGSGASGGLGGAPGGGASAGGESASAWGVPGSPGTPDAFPPTPSTSSSDGFVPDQPAESRTADSELYSA
ncbi:single-stranded DNA-binding protein [Subtercola sp. YIM 133946]|uniref:single-stranded DNA-binding protein n=1 Tax=Subtercola sp. YIM 133946 TaxID=3118909 RepID=UPI002F9579F2